MPNLVEGWRCVWGGVWHGLVWFGWHPARGPTVSRCLRAWECKEALSPELPLPWQSPAHGVCPCRDPLTQGLIRSGNRIHRSLACASAVQLLDQPFRVGGVLVGWGGGFGGGWGRLRAYLVQRHPEAGAGPHVRGAAQLKVPHEVLEVSHQHPLPAAKHRLQQRQHVARVEALEVDVDERRHCGEAFGGEHHCVVEDHALWVPRAAAGVQDAGGVRALLRDIRDCECGVTTKLHLRETRWDRKAGRVCRLVLPISHT